MIYPSLNAYKLNLNLIETWTLGTAQNWRPQAERAVTGRTATQNCRLEVSCRIFIFTHNEPRYTQLWSTLVVSTACKMHKKSLRIGVNLT